MRPSPSPLTVFVLAFGLGAAPSAWAQDDWDSSDDFTFEGDDAKTDDSQRLDKDDDLDSVNDEGDEALDEFADPEDESVDLLGEAPPAAASSGDSPSIYRDAQAAVEDAPPDDEIQAWEEYLATYPSTPFRDRIEKRIAALQEDMYNSRIGRGGGGPIDAMDQEIRFAQGLLLENIDPRDRLQVGVEWGLPAYINLFLDFEKQIVRNFSAHGGVKRRYTGYNVEAGVHYAVVKSTRTNTLVTLIGDLHFNTDPAWPGFRPQLAIGKRFGEDLDVQLQGGADLELWAFDSGMPVRLIGGANLTYDASDTVKIFLESAVNMKELTRAGGNFRYNTVTFGMKFFPKKDKRTEAVSDDVEVNMGATVPYTYNYWTYHYGSVMVQSNLYL